MVVDVDWSTQSWWYWDWVKVLVLVLVVTYMFDAAGVFGRRVGGCVLSWGFFL
jgi:hypothetical protein